MNDKLQIKESELRTLLGNESTADETLERYFEVDDSTPFASGFRLRQDVEVIQEDEFLALEGIGGTVVGLANRLARRKRIKRYRKILEKHPKRRRVVSEGDSWFQHPLVEDTIDHLFNHFAIYSLGAAGDELSNIFNENEYVPALETQDAKVLLLSGGGNDLMGGRFGSYLNKHTAGTDPKRFLNDEFFSKVRDMMNIYRAIFTSMKQQMPQVTIFTHGYDYVVPGTAKKGKWLGKPMQRKGIREQADKEAVIRVVIDEFNDKMESLAHEFDNVEFVDMRGTVRQTQWHDEIHPDALGFQQVALRFFNRVNAAV